MTANISAPECFALLGNRRRLRIVRVLHEGPDRSLSTSELAERIGVRAHGDPTDEELRDIRITLHHNHLPRLEDAGVLRYDRDENAVAPRANFDALGPLIERATGVEAARLDT